MQPSPVLSKDNVLSYDACIWSPDQRPLQLIYIHRILSFHSGFPFPYPSWEVEGMCFTSPFHCLPAGFSLTHGYWATSTSPRWWGPHDQIHAHALLRIKLKCRVFVHKERSPQLSSRKPQGTAQEQEGPRLSSHFKFAVAPGPSMIFVCCSGHELGPSCFTLTWHERTCQPSQVHLQWLVASRLHKERRLNVCVTYVNIT